MQSYLKNILLLCINRKFPEYLNRIKKTLWQFFVRNIFSKTPFGLMKQLIEFMTISINTKYFPAGKIFEFSLPYQTASKKMVNLVVQIKGILI